MQQFFILILAFFPIWIAAQPVAEAPPYITSNTTWYSDTIYHLSSVVHVKNDAVLTIQPGTRIKSGLNGGLLITRGSKIMTLGECDRPIVFTHDSSDLTYPRWVGIAILGWAPANCTFPYGYCMDVIGDPGPDSHFGGTIPDDNSGILRYVIIEHAGRFYNPSTELGYTGLSLAGVGSGTTVEYVQVRESGGTGIALIGGSVNLRHIVCKYNRYDNLSITDGYTGNIQFFYAVRKADYAYYFAKSLQSENNDSGNTVAPITNAAISNATLLIPQQPTNGDLKEAIFLRRQSNSSVYNSAVVGYYPSGIRLSSQGPQTEMRRVFIAGATAAGYDQTATSWFYSSGWNNEFYPNADAVGLENWSSENAVLKPNSILMTASDFTDVPRLSDPFFEKVSYAGAFGLEDWTSGWASENPEDCVFLHQITAENPSSWQVFPNPARDGFTVKNSGVDFSGLYTLYDFMGRLVKIGKLGSPETHIERDNLPAGYYWLKTRNLDGRMIAQKVILD